MKELNKSGSIDEKQSGEGVKKMKNYHDFFQLLMSNDEITDLDSDLEMDNDGAAHERYRG
jgi:hypothetical protein